MEQAVWLAFGVIAIVIGFSVIAGLMNTNKDELKFNKFESGVEQLANQCDFVCDSPLETMLSAEVELPSGMRIYTHEDKICGHLNISEEHEDDTKCEVCRCFVNGTLDLQTDLARRSFEFHDYSCYFLRRENDIQMECQG